MIPKIIHQTFINQECVDSCKTLKYCQDKLLELHPDFIYKFYNDTTDIENYIKDNFSKKYYNAFMNLPKKIMKIDFFRYFLMYKEGGLYCDMDYIFFKPFDILKNKCVLMNEWNNSEYFGNCIFASKPKHEFWKELMKYTLKYKSNPKLLENKNILNVSGPFFMSKIYNEMFKNDTSITVCGVDLFNPPDFDIIKKKIIQELCNNKRSKYDSCNIIDYTEIQEYLKDKKDSYGVHLCASSWTTQQTPKLRSKFSKLR